MRSPNRHGQPAARARARAMQRRLCGGTPAELQRAQRTRLLMLLCVAGAIISSARICRPLGSAGVAFEQLPLWTGGHRVVGRKGNRKRRRLVWSDRLSQIQNETEWRRRYKISSSCFRGMVNALRSQLEAQDVQQAARSSGGLITAELRLSMALRYMAGGHYIDICDLHGVHKDEVMRSVKRVVIAVNQHYGHLMSFPTRDVDKLQSLAQSFWEAGGETLPGCVGAVDGVVIAIEKPRWGEIDNTADMRNRKVPWAMVFQAMCDANLKFTWMACNCTGNTNDSLAWQCTRFHNELLDNPLPRQLWIAGDEAYKGSGTIVTPFPGAESSLPRDLRAFNFYHSRLRMHIERAFGVWKSRWGMFHRPSSISLRLLPKVVRCTMILHNICIDERIQNEVFRGTRREMSDKWPGDDPEPIFNDMKPAELRNIVDVPHAQRSWLRAFLEDKGYLACDPE